LQEYHTGNYGYLEIGDWDIIDIDLREKDEASGGVVS
jgi:hypothetical protein